MSRDGFLDDEALPKRSLRKGGIGEKSPGADEPGSTGVMTSFSSGATGSGGKRRGGAGNQTAVIKVRYHRTGSASKVKASMRYYTTRENERGEKMERQAFARDSDSLDRKETYARLEHADREREYHNQMVLSPGTDQQAEGVDLKAYTRKVMREVEHQQRGSSWVAVEHAGETAHTPRAHIHVIVSTDKKFERTDLHELRAHATRSWREAQENARPLERDQGLARELREMSAVSEERTRRSGRETELPNPNRAHIKEVGGDTPKQGRQGEQNRASSQSESDAAEHGRDRGRER